MNDFYKEQKTEGFIYTVELFVDDGAPTAFCTTLEQAVVVADKVLTAFELSLDIEQGTTKIDSYDWPRIYRYPLNVWLSKDEDEHEVTQRVRNQRIRRWETPLYEARKLRGKA